ncbi:MAG TPA: selenocysteine-specific translation elongation factor [Rubrobacteraceae bacterium]|nr:selenocysteine-specific translation elongation factor [Rubrobacteraceae bacterium]
MPSSGDRAIALTIGTAGHVDHGKTTLVRYMTGTDTDRLEEEHRRGISIVPGYAELELPGGRRASLVDVPGHERFVKNMVAGATGVDAFLLVVAADDGVMPQTREHLDVLRVLGVEQGVVALTKTDVVDEETVELAHLEVTELLEEAGVEAPILPVSGVTGEGVDGLKNALDRLLEGARPVHAESELARLPVDRSFVLKGIGVVVTGTLWTGEVRIGDTLYTGSGLRPRVRSIQNHGHPAETAYAGVRTALDLAGVEPGQIEAGDVLLSRPVEESQALDARVRVLNSARPLKHGVRVRLHHGTRSTNARIRVTGRKELLPGEGALARLRLEDSLVVLAGDRFVLRSMAPQITVGGGTVLDPRPAGRRPDPDWLDALESGDVQRAAPLALARNPGKGMTAEELSLALSVGPAGVVDVLDDLPGVVRIGERYAPAEEVGAARERLLEALQNRAAGHPESPELTIAEARVATALAPELADALISELSGSEIRNSDSGLSLPQADETPPELEAAAKKLLDNLRGAGVEPPAVEPGPATKLLVRRGEAVELGPGLFGAREVAEYVVEEIKSACREQGDISLAGLRDRMGTSRKYAQAWLEYADAVGVTSRTGDVRVLTRRHR